MYSKPDVVFPWKWIKILRKALGSIEKQSFGNYYESLSTLSFNHKVEGIQRLRKYVSESVRDLTSPRYFFQL